MKEEMLSKFYVGVRCDLHNVLLHESLTNGN